ncbi:60S ribosomal export protein NMD3 [Geoglobus ahangari]
MKCASCGRESEYPVCGRCLSARIIPVDVPPVVEVTRCSRCGEYRLDRWRATSLEEAVEYHLSKGVRVHEELHVDEIDFEPVGEEVGRYVFRLSGMLRDYPYSYETFFEVRVRKIACERCSRQAGGYYEAIIQIRASNRSLKDEELETISEMIAGSVEREHSNPRAFISKIEERREGVDVYIGDKRLAQKIARNIARAFGAEMKESSKIAGREDGRDFYRFTYLVRLPEYFVGDIVEEGGADVIVTSVEKRKGYDVMTGKPVNLRNPRVVARGSELLESYVLSMDESTVEILDPYSYEPVTVAKPDFRFRAGDRVFVAKAGERYIVVHESLVRR